MNEASCKRTLFTFIETSLHLCLYYFIYTKWATGMLSTTKDLSNVPHLNAMHKLGIKHKIYIYLTCYFYKDTNSMMP